MLLVIYHFIHIFEHISDCFLGQRGGSVKAGIKCSPNYGGCACHWQGDQGWDWAPGFGWKHLSWSDCDALWAMNNELRSPQGWKKGSVESMQNRSPGKYLPAQQRDPVCPRAQIGKWIFPLFSWLLWLVNLGLRYHGVVIKLCGTMES